MQKERIRKLSEKNRARSYEEYAAEFAKDGQSEVRRAKSETEAELLRDAANTGALGERLSKSGLSGSGYEDYLRSRAELSAKERMDAARHSAAITDLQNRSAYAKYVSRHEEVQSKLADNMIEKLSREAAPNYDKMLSAMLGAGLTEERAEIAAESAYKNASDYAVYRALNFSKQNRLTPLRSKSYALSIGLGEELAERVYNAMTTLMADPYEQYRNLSSEEYDDYIFKLWEATLDYTNGYKPEKMN